MVVLNERELLWPLTDHGGAASQRGPGADVEVVAGGGAHEGQLHVGVGVDATCNSHAKNYINISLRSNIILSN